MSCTHRQNDQIVPFLEKSEHPPNQCNFFGCPVHLSFHFSESYCFLKWTSCILSSLVPCVGMGSAGGPRLNTFMGFSCWICRSKPLQPGGSIWIPLLKCCLWEADWGRRGDGVRCSILTVQPYSARLPFPRCVGCKPRSWILLPQADLLVWIMSVVFCLRDPKGISLCI